MSIVLNAVIAFHRKPHIKRLPFAGPWSAGNVVNRFILKEIADVGIKYSDSCQYHLNQAAQEFSRRYATFLARQIPNRIDEAF